MYSTDLIAAAAAVVPALAAAPPSMDVQAPAARFEVLLHFFTFFNGFPGVGYFF